VINVHNTYNYVTVRRSSRAAALYSTRRMNGYEAQNPTRSFASRTNAPNRYALEQTRTATRNGLTRGYQNESTRSNGLTPSRGTTTGNVRTYNNNAENNVSPTGTRGSSAVRPYQGTREASTVTTPRSNNNSAVRPLQPAAQNNEPRVQQSVPQRSYTPARSYEAPAVRNNPAPAVRNNPAPAVRNNPAPAVRSNPAPAVRSYQAPAVRNTPAPAPQRQMAPSGGSGGRNVSRG
jgi:hypothetical protein